MIHHISIPAKKPEKVANAFQGLFEGDLLDFRPLENAYMFWLGDKYGTAIEIYPNDITLRPGNSKLPCRFKSHDDSRYNTVHAAISCKKSSEDILKIAEEFGWHAAEFSRGAFRVIEFWLENSFLLELLTPEMTEEYMLMAQKHLIGKNNDEVPCLASGIQAL